MARLMKALYTWLTRESSGHRVFPKFNPHLERRYAADVHRDRRGYNSLVALIGALLFTVSCGVNAFIHSGVLYLSIVLQVLVFTPLYLAFLIADRRFFLSPLVYYSALTGGLVLATVISGILLINGRMPSIALQLLSISFVLGFGNQVLRLPFRHAAASTLLCLTVYELCVFGASTLEGWERLVVTLNGLAIGSASLLGNFLFNRETRRFFLLNQRDQLDQITLAAENSELKLRSHTDPLTLAPNRRYFEELFPVAMDSARLNRAPLALLMFDVDNFKHYNDHHGHVAGDDALRQIVQAVQSKLRRDSDRITRYGGDEFAVIVPGSDLEDAAHVAERIRHCVEALQLNILSKGDLSGVLTVSVGIAAMAHDDNVRPEHLLKLADERLYRAKRDGRNTICYTDDGISGFGVHHERNQLTEELRAAVVNEAFVVYFQPQFDFQENKITAFEALVRWQHPRRGLTMPGDFIALAEETGIIVSIGKHVLETACREACTWPEEIRIAVNVSPAQLERPGLFETVQHALLQSGLSPARLELELTENVTIHNSRIARDTLSKIKGLGITLALDDFGTGYSSLTYLHRMDFDKIKIDRSFVSSMKDDSDAKAIIRAVIYLARGLGIKVLAEGVETAEQLELLRAKGCDSIQGYLMGRPAPANQIADMLSVSAS